MRGGSDDRDRGQSSQTKESPNIARRFMCYLADDQAADHAKSQLLRDI